jgi:hypothetical protein
MALLDHNQTFRKARGGWAAWRGLSDPEFVALVARAAVFL